MNVMSRILLGIFIFFGVHNASAQNVDALRTPPTQIGNLSKSELNAFGMRLASEAYKIMSSEGIGTGNAKAIARAKALFDDAALIQNARLSYGLTKKTFTPTDISSFTLSNMAVTRAGEDVLVLSFDVSMPDRVDVEAGTLLSGKKTPRLVVLRWNPQKRFWLVVSSADFDTPIATLCGEAPKGKFPRSQFKKADIALANQLLTNIEDSSFTGTERRLQSDGFQFVLSSGERKIDVNEPIRARIQRRYDRDGLEAITTGNLHILRFNSRSSLILDGGNAMENKQPNLFTFYRGADGEWKQLALAIFAVTARVGNNLKCVERPKGR